MNAESHSSQLEGITCQENLPIDWQVVPAWPAHEEQHHIDRVNEEVLKNILLKDEAPQEGEELEEMAAREHFRRIENKLDLLLSLVSEMMTSNGNIPPKHDLTLGARGMRVNCHEAELATLKEGALLKIRLFLDPQFPRPLEISGTLSSQQSDSFTVVFAPLENRLQDLLDKLVFRRHRRAVASSRRVPGT